MSKKNKKAFSNSTGQKIFKIVGSDAKSDNDFNLQDFVDHVEID